MDSVWLMRAGHRAARSPVNLTFGLKAPLRRSVWSRIPVYQCRRCSSSSSRSSSKLLFSFLFGAAPLKFRGSLGVSDSSLSKSLQPEKHSSVIPPHRRKSRLRYLLFHPWKLFLLCIRFIKVSLTFFPLVVLYPIARLRRDWKIGWLKLLLRAFEFSGPTFMKLGQWMSTRRDIFSPELCSIFSTLHRSVPAHSFSHTIHALDSAFAKTWRNRIHFVSKIPVGSGCVGQVYKVKVRKDAVDYKGPDPDSDSIGPFDIIPLNEPNQKLRSDEELIDAALKVLHPRIEERINRDLIILELGATILEFLFRDLRWLRVKDSILEFSRLMNRQLDLRVEADNLDLFRHNFAHNQSVQFPVPYRPYVSKHVLLESWEEGIPMGEFVNRAGSEELQQKLADIGVAALLKMAFIDNFVHADMHPGNLFVKNPSANQSRQSKLVYEDLGDTVIVGIRKKPLPLNLVIIDAGLTASLSEYDFDSFKGVFAGVVLGDGAQVADKFLKHATANACKDPEGFRRDMTSLVVEARRNLSLNQVDVSKLLSELFSLMVKYHVKLESNFVSIMLSIMVLEGLGRSLDPNLDILEKAKPVILKRLMTKRREKVSVF